MKLQMCKQFNQLKLHQVSLIKEFLQIESIEYYLHSNLIIIIYKIDNQLLYTFFKFKFPKPDFFFNTKDLIMICKF